MSANGIIGFLVTAAVVVLTGALVFWCRSIIERAARERARGRRSRG